MLTRSLDFAAYAEQVKNMSTRDIWYALEDIRKTLPMADQRDKLFPTGNMATEGGYYRDQASVLRAELKNRCR